MMIKLFYSTNVWIECILSMECGRGTTVHCSQNDVGIVDQQIEQTADFTF